MLNMVFAIMLACDTKEIVIVWQRWAKTPQERLKCLEMWRLIEKIDTDSRKLDLKFHLDATVLLRV